MFIKMQDALRLVYSETESRRWKAASKRSHMNRYNSALVCCVNFSSVVFEIFWLDNFIKFKNKEMEECYPGRPQGKFRFVLWTKLQNANLLLAIKSAGAGVDAGGRYGVVKRCEQAFWKTALMEMYGLGSKPLEKRQISSHTSWLRHNFENDCCSWMRFTSAKLSYAFSLPLFSWKHKVWWDNNSSPMLKRMGLL